ncbi:hypothetical protein SGRIM128S_02255 [Streptomyces griseomycini]
MTTTDQLDRAVADPIGLITGLVTDAEEELGVVTIRTVVTAVADGRARSRQVARALAVRFAALTDGRSPAPRMIGDLLIEFRKAGAPAIAAPVCAECGKQTAHPPARGAGLALLGLRAGDRRVHRLRKRPTRQLPGPQGPGALFDASRHRRP